MMKNDNRSEDALFQAAINLPEGQARTAFLDQACAGDDALRKRLEALLEAHERNTSVVDVSALLPTQEGLRLNFPTEENPGQVIGRYKLLQKIGEGGMGVVYMAEQEEPVRRRVALKIIKLGMDTRQVVARFEAERQALALMDHPNIARVFDGGATEAGRPYFVMELVQGVPITTFCDKNKLPARERLKLFIQVCQAIQSAHQKAIIHRDLKPSNVLVTLHHGEPMVKVIDFGVAKATNQKLTEKTLFTNHAAMIGTPAYMSPEQAEMSSLDVDTRTDIYALGVMLYELLAGSLPFPEQRLRSLGYGEMRRVIMEEEPDRPSTRLGTLTLEQKSTVARNRGEELAVLSNLLKGDLDWIAMKCLEKDRRRRYETALDLAADLKRHLENEPVTARPPSAAYRFQKMARRNSGVFAAVAVIALVLVIGVVASTWQAVRARQAERMARNAEAIAIKQQQVAEQAQQAENKARQRADAEKAAANHNLYVANMNLAQQAWEENNIQRLRQLLEDTKDSHHRGFEWYYWQNQTHLALRTLRGHLAEVNFAAYSPDGRRILTGSSDGTAKVWDAVSGREIFTIRAHEGRLLAAYSPDGQRIITAGNDKTVKVWDAATGRELFKFKQDGDWCYGISFSPDSRRIALCNGKVKVCDALNGQELHALPDQEQIIAMAFSPDGQHIVTGGLAKIKVWDAMEGEPMLVFGNETNGIHTVAFSPDGQRIATASYDTVKIREAVNGSEVFAIKFGSWIGSLSYSPDGRRIAIGSSVTPIAKVIDATNGQELLAFKGHNGGILSIAFSPDGQRILTSSTDKTVMEWDATRNNEVLTFGAVKTDDVNVLACSSDGQRILGSIGDEVKVWDGVGHELVTLKGIEAKPFGGAEFSPDNQRFATVLWRNNTASVWETASGREVLVLKGHNDGVSYVAFSPNNKRIITASRDRTARVWDALTGQEILVLVGHSGWINYAVFSPNGQHIVTCGEDGVAKVWDATSGRELFSCKSHNGQQRIACFSPDSKRIVTCDDDTVKVWDIVGGTELLAYKGHGGGVTSIAFCPDGQRILTCASDNTAKLWEADTGRDLLTLKRHRGEYIATVTFTTNGQKILDFSNFGMVLVWESARMEQVARWQEEERKALESMALLEREFKADKERRRLVRLNQSIKQWLVLGPIALAPGLTVADGLDLEQIEGENRLRPKAGEARTVGVRELHWGQVNMADTMIDLNLTLGHATTQCVAYAVCYLQSEAEHRGLQVFASADAGAKIYLNGKEVYKAPLRLIMGGTQLNVPDITLNAGLNVLVFKLVKEAGSWRGSVRLTDDQGNSVKGITVTLDPEEKWKGEINKP